jgi:hypothetical protein
MAAVDAGTGERRLSADELIRLSREKTARLGRELGLEGPKLTLGDRA